MKEAISALSLFAPGELDTESTNPQYNQLVERIKGMLLDGRLVVGQLMPSTRELADHLQVSRKTIRRAYEELLSQGYFESERGIGTFVAARAAAGTKLGDRTAVQLSPSVLSPYAQSLLAISPAPSTLDVMHLLNFDAAPNDLLPVKQWRQCTLELWREYDWTEVDYSYSPEYRTGLQRALVDFLLRSRGLTCRAEQISVFGSVMAPIWLLSRLLLAPGDPVAVENPGYPHARSVFQKLGCRVTGIPIDDEGLDVGFLEKLNPVPKLIFVSPSHEPTGMTLSMQRREHLIWLAKKKNILIIESDYDYEFDCKYSRLPTLFSMCDSDQVILLSYFWKTLYPLVTCGFLVMPTIIREAFNRALVEADNSTFSRLPCITEATLSRFLDRGILERHIHKIAPVYAARQRALYAAVTRELGDIAVLARESAGTRLCMKLNTGLDQQTVLELASDADFSLAPIAPFYMENAPRNEYIVPFGHLDEKSIQTAVAAFARKLRRRLGSD